MLEDTVAESRVELTKLESLRVQSQRDVDGLTRWLEEHKAHLQQTLMEALTAVDRAGALWQPPSTRPVEVPPEPPAAAPAPLPAPPPQEVEASGPDTAMWHPAEDEHLDEPELASAYPPPPPAPRSAPLPPLDVTDGPDDQALDDFFDDNDDFVDDRRFGGRLRRRR
jgi:hypothetical protein